ncbi:hypothetical protein AAFF_G00130320 [Aldrovandia affinis]|uniref:Uncharacterized protein n=1 Tax=Aldrovandia affinis TaxID=143900 RepID=A0AAD7WAF5_9TELE|nr:hypothetical protein AAFF_G00130320 [Aldrovandia affinis]
MGGLYSEGRQARKAIVPVESEKHPVPPLIRCGSPFFPDTASRRRRLRLPTFPAAHCVKLMHCYVGACVSQATQSASQPGPDAHHSPATRHPLVSCPSIDSPG